MKQSLKKITVFMMMLVLLSSLVPASNTEAASKYAGTYTKTYKVKGLKKGTLKPSYSVIINNISKGKIRFMVEYYGINGSPIYQTNIVTSKIKNNVTTFKWKDSWYNSGKGRMKVYKKYVLIKMVQTKSSKWNRSTLDTGNKYYKLPKKSNRRKVYAW